MAETLGEVTVQITGDTSKLEASLTKAKSQAVALSNSLGGNRGLSLFAADLGKATSALTGLGNRMQSAVGQASAFANGFMRALAPVVGITGTVALLTKAFRDFASEQRDITILATQIKLLGANVGVTIDELESFTDALKKQTGQTDDSIRAAERLGLQLGLTGKGLFDLTRLATDLATVMGSDVPTAMQTLARTANNPIESLRLLKRVLPISQELEDNAKALDKMGDRAGAANLILNTLQTRIGGIAQTVHDTTAQGRLDDLSNALNDLSESVGGLLAQPAVVGLIEDIASGINGLSAALDKLGSSEGSLRDFLHYLDSLGSAQMQQGLRQLGLMPNVTPLAPWGQRINPGPMPGVMPLISAVTLPQERPIHLVSEAVIGETKALKGLADTASTTAGQVKQLTDAQMHLVEELKTAQSVTRDFAGTFVHDLLDGKTAIESLTDALKHLENRLIDIALDRAIQGLFAGIAGGLGVGSAFTGKGVGLYQHGGRVGGAGVPLWHGERLTADEFPAILHVGETVIPARQRSSMSGRDMVRMFGGVPRFEGGFNAAAAAAGAYTAGDTGATGQWSSVSGGGGNATLSNLLASQYTTQGGGGPISLGSGLGSHAGGTVSIGGGHVVGGGKIGGGVGGVTVVDPFGGARAGGFLVGGRTLVSPIGSLGGYSGPLLMPETYTGGGYGYNPGFEGPGFMTGPLGPAYGIPWGGFNTPWETAGVRRQRRTGSYAYHGGGYVGSTPGAARSVADAVFRRAPRLHSGLAADEYPAILQRGERVIPAGGGGGSKVELHIHNNNGSQVTARQTDNGMGGVRLDVMVDELVSAKMLDHGSRISRAMRINGTDMPPIRR